MSTENETTDITIEHLNRKTTVRDLIDSVNRLTEFTYDIQKMNKTGGVQSIAVDFNDLLNTVAFIRLLKATQRMEEEFENLKNQVGLKKKKEKENKPTPLTGVRLEEVGFDNGIKEE